MLGIAEFLLGSCVGLHRLPGDNTDFSCRDVELRWDAGGGEPWSCQEGSPGPGVPHRVVWGPFSSQHHSKF